MSRQGRGGAILQELGGGGGVPVAPLRGNSSPSPIMEVQYTGKNYVL